MRLPVEGYLTRDRIGPVFRSCFRRKRRLEPILFFEARRASNDFQPRATLATHYEERLSRLRQEFVHVGLADLQRNRIMVCD